MKTMTVNEIIKAFERCDQLYSVCRGCPLYNKDHCRDQLKRAIIDKLNCQQDELRKLRKQIKKLRTGSGVGMGKRGDEE